MPRNNNSEVGLRLLLPCRCGPHRSPNSSHRSPPCDASALAVWHGTREKFCRATEDRQGTSKTQLVHDSTVQPSKKKPHHLQNPNPIFIIQDPKKQLLAEFWPERNRFSAQSKGLFQRFFQGNTWDPIHPPCPTLATSLKEAMGMAASSSSSGGRLAKLSTSGSNSSLGDPTSCSSWVGWFL